MCIRDRRGTGNGHRQAQLFRELLGFVGELGLVSAYHELSGEAFGDESRSTRFHQRKPNPTFHIDYCFVPREWASRVTRIEIGTMTDWLPLSDHMPLILDIET